MKSGSTIFTRVAWGIVAGFVVIHIASVVYWGHERMVGRAQTFAVSTVDRSLALLHLNDVDKELLARLTGAGFDARFVDSPPQIEGNWPHNAEITQAVHDHLLAQGFDAYEDARFGFRADRGRGRFAVALPTAEGRWLFVDTRTDVPHGRHSAGIVWMTLLLAIVLIAVLLVTRRHTRYISGFVDAAESLGTLRTVSELPEQKGPREIRRASAAFNRMLKRVNGLLDERASMLGAVSHDLRTIATRLRLRADFINDADQQSKAVADLDEMAVILEEALTFTSDETSQEALARVDLSSMLRSLVDDAVDLGADAEFIGEDGLQADVQPVAAKRAFANLLDNALKYGGSARVSVEPSVDEVCIRVVDPGPGMTEDEISRALRPWVRLEGSRNRETGGTGLGLAIVRNVVERHEGRLRFERGDEGFGVEVLLPRSTIRI